MDHVDVRPAKQPKRSRARAPSSPPFCGEALTAQGFLLVAGPAGSLHPLGIRACLDTGFWLCCDMHVPPLSWSSPEQLQEGKMLLVSVLAAEPGTFVAEID